MDTACSASLVASHLAATSLERGECRDGALAAGVNLLLVPDTYTVLAAASLLSPAGRCKALDADGDGYGRGEACIAFTLKPFSGGLLADDAFVAILGSAVNQDGLSSSLTAPNGRAQQAVVTKVRTDPGKPCLRRTGLFSPA